MQRFTSTVEVTAPRGPLLAAVRDRLPDLLDAFDDVERIEQLDREELADGRIRVVNLWLATQRVPDRFARAVGGSEVGWVDRSVWDADAGLCRWRIEPSVLTAHIDCHGTTRYDPLPGDGGTRVRSEGTFTLARGALRGLAGPLDRPVGAFVETVVTTMVPRNTRRMVEAASALVLGW